MAKQQKRIADEDGNELPELDPNSDMAKIIFLLEYARRRGFQVGPTIQVGDTIIQVRDIRQVRAESRQDDSPPAKSIWAEHGHE